MTVGDRRQGLLLYRTACPNCNACEPIRLDVESFRPNRSQRRTFARGERDIRVEIGPLEPTAEKVHLYNKHKQGRALNSGDDRIDFDGYRAFLGETCCDSFELRYYHENRLIAVAITDRSDEALSAVYCFFDPNKASLGPGTYSILKQLDLARAWGLRYVYLGLYIANCDAMAYKGRFLPHERRLGNRWVVFDSMNPTQAR